MILDAISRSNNGAKGLQRLPRAHHCSETTLSRYDEGQVPRESDQPDAGTVTPGIARVDDSDHGSCQSRGRDEYVRFGKQVISLFCPLFVLRKFSSEDEALPNSLASFFAPQETPSSSNLSAAGTSGDLDSRLANILNPQQQQSAPRPRARASRWDTGEASHGNAPPLPPPQMLHQPRLNTPPNAYNHAGSEGFNGSVPDWQAPKPPQNQYEMPARYTSFHYFSSINVSSWGSPQKQYGQNGQQNMNGPPRGGFSGGPHRGGYAPRTPQGQRPPRPHFHSEGPYGRGRGGPRGGRGFFTPRYSHFYLFSVSTCRLKSITEATLSKATWLWRNE